MSGLPLWPPALSAYAAEIDLLFGLFLAVVAALALPVFVLLVVFAIRYRRGSQATREGRVHRHPWLEASWAAIPFTITLIFFVWAAQLYVRQQTPPAGALEISAVAKQWMWKFQHPNGAREINELHVPVGETVKVTMISQDVIHSLYFPSLRIKQDVLPGRYTSLWFEATEPGVHHLLCTEYCGTSHSQMSGQIVVLEPAAYARWLEVSEADLTLAERGEDLFRRYGCSGCHENSDVVRAPPLEGVYGSPVPLASGEVVIADEGYIRDSILLPTKAVVAGYKPIMPSFAGKLGEDDLLLLVAYVKSLADQPDYRDGDPGRSPAGGLAEPPTGVLGYGIEEGR